MLTIAIMIPLVLTSAYFEPTESLPLSQNTEKNTESDPDENAKGDIPAISEDSITQSTERDDAFIFGIEEDDGFALSPLFQNIINMGSLKDEESDQTQEKEEEQLPESGDETNEEITDEPQIEETEKEDEEAQAPETDDEIEKEEEKTESVPEKLPNFNVSFDKDLAAKEDETSIKVYMHKTKSYKYMSLTEYLYGVVVAEMPAYFEIEALKSQAIACRSISLYKMVNGNFNADRHGSGGAHICTYSGHCQSYISYEEAVEKWGKAYADSIFEKVRPAIDATKGMVMTYDGQPIDAAYHSMSYKYTDDVKNVWPTCTHPYLQSVSSPENDDFDGVDTSETISADKFKKNISAKSKSAAFSSDPAKWIGKITYNKSGRIDTIVIGGVSFTGREIQSVFGLRASNYTIKYNAEDDAFTITTYGRGHGVGMSQYGANLLAKDGYTCEEILLHYYTGVKIESFAFADTIKK